MRSATIAVAHEIMDAPDNTRCDMAIGRAGAIARAGASPAPTKIGDIIRSYKFSKMLFAGRVPNSPHQDSKKDVWV